jgi:pimeloyl-ACP methyl ester carboxylesterase
VHKKKMDDCDAIVKIITGHDVHLRLFSPETTTTVKHYGGERLVLYFHGNSEDLESCDAYLSWLALNLHQNVLGVDYVGYGRSSGEHDTTEQNMCDAADACLHFATHVLKHKTNTVTIIGRSLGSIPAVYLCSQRRNAGLGGLILISALASGARCLLPCAYVPKAILNSLDGLFGPNIQRIPEVQCMILFIHGDKDAQVPLENSKVLIEKCNRWCGAELFVVKGGTHNNLSDLYGKDIIRKIKAFVEESSETSRLRSGDEQSHTPYEEFIEF